MKQEVAIFAETIFGLIETDKKPADFTKEGAETCYTLWLHAAAKGAEFASPRCAGKWMIFPPDEQAQHTWDVLLQGIESGVITRIKCSVPCMENPNYTPGTTAIFVYTDDYRDKDDVASALAFLRQNNLFPEEPIYYKTDEQTRKSHLFKKHFTWFYCSYDFPIKE